VVLHGAVLTLSDGRSVGPLLMPVIAGAVATSVATPRGRYIRPAAGGGLRAGLWRAMAG
jgi:hypothetical protein